ncbi:MAG: lactonase family protein [Eubacteriales bacterium]
MKTRLVFIGSYSQPIVLGTGETSPGSGDGVTVFRMDEQGNLTRLFSAGKPNPTYLALSPDQRFLYTVNELKEYHEEPSAAVSAYAINAGTGEIAFLNRRMSGGADACYVHVSSDGKYLFVANFTGGSFAALPIQPDGSLGTASCFVQHYGGGAHPQRQEAPHVHQTTPDPSGKHLLVADLGKDEISVYGIDWGCGCVIKNAAPTIRTEPGDGPRQFVFDQSGRFLYLVNELSNTVRAYRYNAETGEAEFLQSSHAAKRVRRTHRRLHQATPGWEFLYASNRGYDSTQSYRHTDGALTPLSITKCIERRRATSTSRRSAISRFAGFQI